MALINIYPNLCVLSNVLSKFLLQTGGCVGRYSFIYLLAIQVHEMNRLISRFVGGIETMRKFRWSFQGESVSDAVKISRFINLQ
jgi:hypothetical protein